MRPAFSTELLKSEGVSTPHGFDGTESGVVTERMALRIGLIGLGKTGKIHWENLGAMDDIRLIAVSEVNPENCRNLPNEIRQEPDWRDLVRSVDIDAVIITLPHSLHANCAEAALREGKHVFLEKPLATTLADAQRIVACAREEERILMVNMTHRFYPPVRRARELLREGVIGEVVSIRDYYMEIIDRSDFPGWFFDPVLAGGGVAMTDSIHLIDRVIWLLDEPLDFIGAVSRHMAPDTLVEDCAEILCASRSGVPVSINSFFFTGQKAWEDGLTIFGTKGTLSVHAWSHLVWTPHGGEPVRIEGYDPNLPLAERSVNGHRAAVREFISAIQEGRAPEADAVTALDAQEVLQRFYDSSDSEFAPNVCVPA